jgi:hypothetical protein
MPTVLPTRVSATTRRDYSPVLAIIAITLTLLWVFGKAGMIGGF